MSHVISFGSCITDRARLTKACDRLRTRNVAIVGPRYVTGVYSPSQPTVARDGYAIKLPGWSRDAVFFCDAAGEMAADNYSPYFDNRKIGKDGKRIAGSGTVHPDVAEGKRRVGEAGRWGDIAELDRLCTEYQVVTYEEYAAEHGGRIAYRGMDAASGATELLIELPG